MFFKLFLTYICKTITTTKNNNNMENQNFFESEWKRRENLVMDIKFRKAAVKAAKSMGITAKEWNENKAVLLLFFANQYCAIENKIESKN